MIKLETLLDAARWSQVVMNLGTNARDAMSKGGTRRLALDLGMPGMRGKNCLEELLRIDPSAQVVVATGYAGQDHVAGLNEIAPAVRSKPYRLQELLEILGEVLADTRH